MHKTKIIKVLKLKLEALIMSVNTVPSDAYLQTNF